MKYLTLLLTLTFSSSVFSANEYYNEKGGLVLYGGSPCDMNRCAIPNSSVANRYCAHTLQKEADVQLNRIYNMIKKNLSKSHKKLLKKAQRTWLKNRNETMLLNNKIAAHWPVYVTGVYIQECKMTRHRNLEFMGTYQLLMDQKRKHRYNQSKKKK
jgi:uncharacterized protein YecT (DUF1311 family)